MQNGLGLAVAFVGSVVVSVGLTRSFDALRAPPARSEPARGASTVQPMPAQPSVGGPPRAAAELSPARAFPIQVPQPANSAPPEDGVSPEERATADLEKVRFETEQSFEVDAPADARSRIVERDMQRVLERAAVKGASIESVSCKRTTCRAVIRSSDAASNKSTLERMADEREGPFAQFGFIVPGRDEDASGAIRSTVFITLK